MNLVFSVVYTLHSSFIILVVYYFNMNNKKKLKEN